MIARASNIARPSAPRTFGVAAPAREPRKVREDRLRRRAGAAMQNVPGDTTELGALIGRTHTAISNRRKGLGPLGDLLCEAYALEAAGRDTTALVEALLLTQAEARAARAEPAPIRELTRAEAEADALEDQAEDEWKMERTPAAARRWQGALAASVAAALQMIGALSREVA